MVAIVLAGGGTAGHTSPLIATAQRLRALAPDARILCVGTPKGLESRVIPEAGLTLRMIPPVPLPRRADVGTAGCSRATGRGGPPGAAILAEHRADVVVGFGGYVSLPVYLAAKSARIPVVLHEQNAVPGLANKIAARFTQARRRHLPGHAAPARPTRGTPATRRDRRAGPPAGPCGRPGGARPGQRSAGAAGQRRLPRARSINNATARPSTPFSAPASTCCTSWARRT